MMDMHGMFFDFPVTFRKGETGGIRPIASHHRYIPDFCHWNGQLILAADDASMMENPMVGQPQSNLWFGTMDDLAHFGPRSGWGGPWVGDPVESGVPSDPFLVDGFEQRVLHLAHDADHEVTFALEVDRDGTENWTALHDVRVPSGAYRYDVFPADFRGSWVRITADKACCATAYFHQVSQRPDDWDVGRALISGLAEAASSEPVWAGLIRPAGHNTTLQFLACQFGDTGDQDYREVDGEFAFQRPAEDRRDEVREIARITKDFTVDDASVIMEWRGARYRLPKGDSVYDQPFACGWPRGIREVQSERNLANIHGTFYEIPRDDGIPKIKPVCTHGKQLMDYCSWRGLLVLSGVRADAAADGHVFVSDDGDTGLWFGAVDDLWQFGKPVGHGGPWFRTPVQAGAPSDPYLMTGYDHKRMELSHDSDVPVTFTVEVDVAHNGWFSYAAFLVEPGATVVHDSPIGYNAHWVRATADSSCTATAQLAYE